jgi:hypothetical protein
MSTNSPEEAHEETEIPPSAPTEEPSTEREAGGEPKEGTSADRKQARRSGSES